MITGGNSKILMHIAGPSIREEQAIEARDPASRPELVWNESMGSKPKRLMKIGFVSLISACALSWLVQDHFLTVKGADSQSKSEFAITTSLAKETPRQSAGGSGYYIDCAASEVNGDGGKITLAAKPSLRRRAPKRAPRKQSRGTDYGE